MQFRLCSFFFTAAVFFLAWTAAAQSAPINAKAARIAIVDVAKDGLSRRVDGPVDGTVYMADELFAQHDLSRLKSVTRYTLADAESRQTKGNLARRADSSTDGWYEISPLTMKRHGDLQRGNENEKWYTLIEIEPEEGE